MEKDSEKTKQEVEICLDYYEAKRAYLNPPVDSSFLSELRSDSTVKRKVSSELFKKVSDYILNSPILNKRPEEQRLLFVWHIDFLKKDVLYSDGEIIKERKLYMQQFPAGIEIPSVEKKESRAYLELINLLEGNDLQEIKITIKGKGLTFKNPNLLEYFNKSIKKGLLKNQLDRFGPRHKPRTRYAKVLYRFLTGLTVIPGTPNDKNGYQKQVCLIVADMYELAGLKIVQSGDHRVDLIKNWVKRD